MLASHGLLLSWDLASNEVRTIEHDLRERGVEFHGNASSGARRWSGQAFTPDLSSIAYWIVDKEQKRATLCVRHLADGKEFFQRTISANSITSPIVFHPTRSLVGVFDTNKCLWIFDYKNDNVVVENGPQLHTLSFSSNDTLLYDDWYGHTQEFDYTKGTSRLLSTDWNSHGSLSDRYVNGGEKLATVRSKGKKAKRKLQLENVQEYLFSAEGTRLVVFADALCGWNLGPPRP